MAVGCIVVDPLWRLLDDCQCQGRSSTSTGKAARSALDKAFLDQVRLDYLLDDIAFVAECRRHRLDPDRTACIVFGNATQVTPVHAVEAPPIDIEPQQCRIGGSS